MQKKERSGCFLTNTSANDLTKDFHDRKHLTNYSSFLFILPINGLSMRLSLRVAQMLLADLDTFCKTYSQGACFFNCPPAPDCYGNYCKTNNGGNCYGHHCSTNNGGNCYGNHCKTNNGGNCYGDQCSTNNGGSRSSLVSNPPGCNSESN